MSTSVETGRARAWAWVAHLRAGGTTPWRSWTASDAGDGGRFLPGAQQLELLRRLNDAGRPSTALAARVVGASAPGRGRPDLELVGVDEARRFGPPAVDPAVLPDEELLRVATGLLALGLVTAGVTTPPARQARRFRTRYQLAGDPWLASTHTRALTADGRPPGGGGRSVLVLGADVATMLAHTWSADAFGPAAPGWPEFLARVRARRRLPQRICLADVAERFRALPHTGEVSVVLDPTVLPGLVGSRSLAPAADVPAHAVELARHVGIALSLHVLPDDQATLLDTGLRPRLAGVPGALPAIPPEHQDWVEDAGFALRQRLLRARYPVVGDPDVVLSTPTDEETPTGSVLALAIELLLEEDR